MNNVIKTISVMLTVLMLFSNTIFASVDSTVSINQNDVVKEINTNTDLVENVDTIIESNAESQEVTGELGEVVDDKTIPQNTVELFETIGAPVATDVVIAGTQRPGYTLKGTYNCSTEEQGSRYRWLASSAENGSYTAILGEVGNTLLLKNAQGNKYVKFEVTPVSNSGIEGVATTSAAVKIAAPIGPANTTADKLPGAVENTPAEYLFKVKGNSRIFALIDQTADNASKYFVMGTESYCKSLYDLAESQRFDAENKKNIGWMLNNVLTGKEAAWDGITSASILKFPEEINEHINYNHEWLTEAGALDAGGTCPDDYVAIAGVTLLSSTEYATYASKIGYYDGISGYWYLRTGRGISNGGKTKLMLAVQASSSPAGRLNQADATSGSGTMIRPAFYLDNDFFSTVALDVSSMGDEVKKTILENYNVSQLSAIYSKEELEKIGFVNLPEAQDVDIKGSIAIGETLCGKYTYVTPNGKNEQNSRYRWLFSDTADGDFEEISGAYDLSWKVENQYVGKYIKFEVMPCNELLIYGLPSQSKVVGPIRENQDISVNSMTITDVDGNQITNFENVNEIKVTANITNRTVAKSPCVVFTLYDDQQHMIANVWSILNVTSGTKDYEVNMTTNGKGKAVGATVLSSVDDMRPIAAIGEIATDIVSVSNEEITVTQSAIDNSITVKGKMTGTSFNKLIFVKILNGTTPIYAATIFAGDDGFFSHKFQMSADILSDDYTLCIGTYDNPKPYVMSFYYANAQEVASVYNDLTKIKDTANMQAFLSLHNQAVLGIKTPFFDQIPIDVCKTLTETETYNSPATFKQIALKELAVEALLNKGDSLSNVKKIMSYFETEFKFNQEKNYSTYETLISDSVSGEQKNNNILSGFINAGCETMEMVRKRFNELVVLELLADTKSYGDVTKLLSKYQGDLEINLNSSDYIKLKDPGLVNSKLVGKRFKSATEFKIYFEEQIKLQLGKESSGTSPGGGPSSSGHGISMSGGTQSAPVPYIPENVDNGNSNKGKYVDLDDAAWAKDTILSLSEKNIIRGYEDGTFLPNNTITREEFVKIIVSAFNIKLKPVETSKFLDVMTDSWYSPYVHSAMDAGIIVGYEDGTFGAGENISRQDMAVMLYRTIDHLSKKLVESKPEKTFTDGNQINDYAASAVKALQMAGVIAGSPEGQFEPDRNATRAEACVMANKLLDGGVLE